MNKKTFNRLIPAFIPLIFSLVRQFRISSAHDSKIKKHDKSQEKIATIEHLMVRMEKKMVVQRDQAKVFNYRIMWWLAINSALLVAIFVKLFFF